MARPSWRLTVRAGPKVDHEGFDDLREAVAAMRERAFRIRAAGPPKAASMLRKYEPEDQVSGRLELSGRGLLNKPVAGIDVRGDGTFVPYRGGLRREELDPSGHDTPFDLVRETLEGADR
ncbi:MAG: hypothetical protein JSU06_03895 [Actinobacteria bacterium]|nr:hypothetical protein [Actinomycetota bacterium]